MMEKCSLNSHEALESVDGYVQRVRKIKLSDIVDYIIETKLSPVQKCTVKDYWFKGIAPAETAQKLGLSLSAVYSSRSKAMEIIKEHIEVLVMYFKDISDVDIAPVTQICLEVLQAEKSSESNAGKALKNIRVSRALDTAVLAHAIGISENELIKIEKGKKEITSAIIEKYSRIFNIDIKLNCVNGEWELKWTDQ